MSIVAPPLTTDNIFGGGLPGDRAVGALWRRAVAAIADGIIVGIAGNIVAFPFFQTFSRLGTWGHLVGFCLALPYFAILNSKIGDGQTLGKRWMHLQVVDANGNTISFERSILRYAVLAVAYYLNGLPLPVTRTPWIVSSLISFLVAVLGGATLYLILFNRHTRQGVHDLAAGSYVADADVIGPLKIRPIWRMHWVILGGLFILVFVAGKIFEDRVSKWAPFPQMLEDVRLVENMKDVQQAGVQDLNWRGSGTARSERIFVVNVFWTGRQSDDEEFANDVAKQIIQNDPKAEGYDVLRITIIHGYNLGIAQAQRSNAFERTPAEWKARLF
jgi:uncharacterized RDD family membrane protein YckC